MVKFLAGQKGQGKTRKLIDMANDAIGKADGHLVYIDDDRRHTREIDRDVRFVEAGKGTLSNYREFVGFVLGIMSMDSDVEHVYVDGLCNIVRNMDNDSLVKLAKKLDGIAKRDEVSFTLTINNEPDTLPEEMKALLI